MPNIRMRKRARILLVGSAAAVALGAAALPAAADDGPTRAKILADCASGTGKCTFNNPVVKAAYLGDYRQVSDTLYNCTTSPATQGLGWSDSVGSTDSIEVSITTGTKLAGIVDLSLTAKYGHTWSHEHSESGNMQMTVKPDEVGWISRAQVMHQIKGEWQTHYDDPHWGHYYWFVPDTITGPAPNDTDGVKNIVIMKTRPMTEEEKASICKPNAKLVRSPVRQEVPKATKAPGDGSGSQAPYPGKGDVAGVNEGDKKKQ